MECIVNTAHISVPASKLKKAQLEPHRIRTGGGIIETDARTWTNQHVFVGNSSVSVSKVTELTIEALDYDMILGYPFLTRHNPTPNWRTGALSFPKFVWHPVAKSYTDVKAQLSALQLTPRQLVHELKKADKDPDVPAFGEGSPPEFYGPKGPEPTRYGDWEQKGWCTDF